MLLYAILRGTWRLLPADVRSWPGLRRMTQPLAGRFREHNQGLYNTGYFERDVDGPASKSSSVIVQSVCRDLGPARVADVGCGSGALLHAFAVRGVETVGLEYSESAREIARRKGVDVRPFDVRFDQVDPDWGLFDVVCCTEMAEHLPGKFADRLVRTLSRLGRFVVFTAATPGQGGVDHVNEQLHEYWIEKFSTAGLELNVSLTESWQSEWKNGGAESWYWRNLMVFARG